MTARGADAGARLHPDRTRQLVTFAAATAFGEALFFTVLAPLLPGLAGELSLSNSGVAVLSASYAAGMFAATLPAGVIAAHIGVRRLARAGMWLIAVASLAFALTASPAALVAARFVQGVGGAAALTGAFAWLIHRSASDQRGSRLGAALGAGFAGTIAAPLLAALAHEAGRAAAFIPTAVILGLFAAWGGPRQVPVHRNAGPPVRPMKQLQGPMASSVSVMLLLGVLLGTMASLGPLLLSDRGVDGRWIAVVFFGAYAPQVLLTPAVGRLADRHGALPVIAAALSASALLVMPVTTVTDPVVLGVLFSVLFTITLTNWTPVSLLVSRVTEIHGGAQELAIAYTNGAWALGATLGAIVLTAASEHVGLQIPFGFVALLALGGALVCVAAWMKVHWDG